MEEQFTEDPVPRTVAWGEPIFFCVNCSHWHWAVDELLDLPGGCGDCSNGEHPDPRVN